MKRTRAQRAQLALTLEVCATPTPGSVDRHREYPDLRFEHFLAGAIGAQTGLELAANTGKTTTGIGRAFERAVAGMSEQEGGNTQFGALLLLTPLVRAAARADLTPSLATEVVEETTVEDAADFYRAFDHVDVAVDPPPEDLSDLDVRQGADAIPKLRDRGLTLEEVMEHSTEHDGIAREWVGGFERTFQVAESITTSSGPLLARAADAFIEQLAAEPDPFIATKYDEATARETRDRAKAVLRGQIDPGGLDQALVSAEINPGTTADLLAGGLYVALERGLEI